MDVKKIQAKRFVVVRADKTYADDYHFMDHTQSYRIFVDTKTGVNYMSIGGVNPSVTPILDSDGKPLIDFWGLPKT